MPFIPKMGGILLYGPTGTGKSRTLWLWAQHYLLESLYPWNIRFLEGSEIADEANSRARSGKLTDWIEEVTKDIDCMLIDDLGHGSFSNSYAEALRKLLERCTSRDITLAVTLQFSGAELLKQWKREDPAKVATAAAIVRRLGEFTHPIRFDHPTKPKATTARA